MNHRRAPGAALRPRPIALQRPPGAAAGPDRGYRVVRPSNLTSGGVAELYLYDAIDSWYGVSAKDVLAELLALSADELHVHLNSPGGDYFEAVAILNGLLAHPAAITVHVDGLAASAASVIAMAGETLIMGIGAQLMIHNSRTVAIGTAADLTASAALLSSIDGDIAALYAERAAATGVGDGDPAIWRAAMDAETWYTAAEAVAVGLADSMAGAAAADPAEPAPDGDPDPAEPDPDADPAAADDPAEPDPAEPDPEGAPGNRMAAGRWVAQWRYAGRSAAPEPARTARGARPAAGGPAPRPRPAPAVTPPAFTFDPDTFRAAFTRKAGA